MSGPIEIFDPAIERFDAATKAVVWTLITTTSAGLISLSLSINDGLAGYILLAVAVLVGSVPLGRLRYARRRSDRLAVSGLTVPATRLLSEASDLSRYIHALSKGAEPGRVQDHLALLAQTADTEILHIHDELRLFTELTAKSYDFDRNSGRLPDSVTDTYSWLTTLKAAAADLAQSQRRALTTSGTAIGRPHTADLELLVEQTKELQRQLTKLG